MLRRVRTPLAFVFAAAVPVAAVSLPAKAADLPQVKITAKNRVPACTTPGRLMGFLESRNPGIDPRFRAIAADYMRIGSQLKIRWDIAFFQMMLETGNLTFKGDVRSTQNNFAGMGATGNHVHGEAFPDVATGVKAHLQHLLMYAGEHIDNPVAERTRKVQEWGVLTDWQKSLTGPVSYDQLAKQWAPTSRRYARDISALTEAFYGTPCKDADPQPELMALGNPHYKPSEAVASAQPDTTSADAASDDNSSTQTAAADTASDDSTPAVSGAALAQRAVEEARKSGSFVRSGLGAESLVPTSPDTMPPVGEQPAADNADKQQAPTAFKIINASAPPTDDAAAAAEPTGPADSAPVEPPPAAKKSGSKKAQTAKAQAAKAEVAKAEAALSNSGTTSAPSSAPGTKTAMLIPPMGVKPKCKVWTASYGGGHSVIIRARADAQDNYTVLDVNEGSEKREADAYIAAYAKGGETMGEFSNPSQALDKAFELCPDG